MKIEASLTDDAVLLELGARLHAARLGLNLTQAAVAEQAGVAKRTVERLESGAVAMQLSSLVRVCRVLGVLDRFDLLVPEPTPSPMAQIKQRTGSRKRATGSRGTAAPAQPAWTWGDEP